ncbi:MAG: S8 family peptidase [Bacteroidota bacterium]|nr:S8 family peptidase [Bacteroidota bacterium]MDP4252819.1 S8 family peptidase [Bacteroidota bacterium]MDP4257726.1 S8 family peptidase [Bacteroidota bacterium]
MHKIFFPFILLFLSASVLAQKANWQNLDLREDSVFGISTEKAYRELLKNKKPQTVIVAVIDGGVDTAHEDLKAVIWNNPNEKPGNGRDDDHNGYVDDVHGWDFIGGATGDVDYDNLELVRVIRRDKPRYEGLTDSTVTPNDRPGYEKYKKMVREWQTSLDNNTKTLRGITNFKNILDRVTSNIGKDTPTLADFEKYIPKDPGESQICKVVIAQLEKDPDFIHLREDDLGGALKHFHEKVDYQLNISYDPRSIVGDDYGNGGQRSYGNNDVTGPNAEHGTHVSGIIGAIRDNAVGVKGVADHVRIMAVRVVPDGDERDKDVANGIRYAADNGAKVINMSFGKGYSWNKSLVDAAVRYAVSKDVLLVHAAGNEGNDLATNDNFPNRIFGDSSGVAAAWIEVGATGYTDDSTLVASFSNYGKTQVDVFAPGVSINSTIPGSKYASFDGTSMASPVVAGLAALIREYYPKLTALQVKDIILRSVVRPGHTVTIQVGGAPKQVRLSDISVSGGIVNAYQALKLAEEYK